jgi:hypothetical protein
MTHDSISYKYKYLSHLRKQLPAPCAPPSGAAIGIINIRYKQVSISIRVHVSHQPHSCIATATVHYAAIAMAFRW